MSMLFEFIGSILKLLKLSIPLIIISIGIFDFFKAVISQNDDQIKKSQTIFLKRMIAGILIFFIPSFVSIIFDIVGVGGSSNVYLSCVMDTKQCKKIEDEENNNTILNNNVDSNLNIDNEKKISMVIFDEGV